MNITPRQDQESVTSIISNIKHIKHLMNQPEYSKLSFGQLHLKLVKIPRVGEFQMNNSTIFNMVISKRDLTTIASILYYKNKVDSGVMTSEELASKVSQKYVSVINEESKHKAS